MVGGRDDEHAQCFQNTLRRKKHRYKFLCLMTNVLRFGSERRELTKGPTKEKYPQEVAHIEYNERNLRKKVHHKITLWKYVMISLIVSCTYTSLKRVTCFPPWCIVIYVIQKCETHMLWNGLSSTPILILDGLILFTF